MTAVTDASPAATAPRVPLPNRGLAVGLLMAITATAFEAVAVATAMPRVAEDLDGDALYGAAFSVFMLASVLALVVGGELADRHGPARPFLVGVGGFAIGLLVVGLAPVMPVVVAGRALQGAGSGLLATVAYVAIGRGWPKEEQARLFALLSAAWVIPSLVGPAAAGAVTEAFGWRWVFLGLLPLAPVLVVLCLDALRRLGPPEGAVAATRSRVPDAAVLALGATFAVLGLQDRRPAVAVVLVAGGAALAWRPLRRLLPDGTFGFATGLAACVAARLAVNATFFGTETFIPLAASRLHGAGPLAAGMVIIGASLVWTAASQLVARRLRTRSPGSLVQTGFVVLAVGILGTLTVTASAIPLWVTFFTWAISGFGIGLVFTTTSTTAMGQAPAGQEGLVGSQLGIADSLGFAIGSGVGGAVVGISERTTIDLAPALATLFVGWAVIALATSVLAPRVGARAA